jgi:hypothetical protein
MQALKGRYGASCHPVPAPAVHSRPSSASGGKTSFGGVLTRTWETSVCRERMGGGVMSSKVGRCCW